MDDVGVGTASTLGFQPAATASRNRRSDSASCQASCSFFDVNGMMSFDNVEAALI